jgi:hypothetical protein
MAVCTMTQRASAALVTWELTGTIRSATGSEFTSLGIVPGAPFVLTAVIDYSVPDDDPRASIRGYSVGLVEASYRAGTYQSHFAGLGFRSLVRTLQEPGFPPPPIENISMGWSYVGSAIGFDLLFPFGTLPTDSLPLTPPLGSLLPYDASAVNMFDNNVSATGLVRGEILGWTIVPEPESLGLAAIAALSLALARRRLTAGGA